MHALFDLATRYREALERAKVGEPYILDTLRDFPNGACGDTSILLAKYLERNGHVGFGYVVGQRGAQAHAWLRRLHTIVDITADQFPDFAEPVFVGTKSAWHGEFEGKLLHEADFEIYREGYTRSTLRSTYRTVSKYL